ncbi:hypothetical protein Back11_58770 [Paenibacillus baekrokdamisoli]|uniref:Uncharacterized protein n=1 Tax=Paenibacillus baekrokdamisoli TaxID=1712516 RepID=A0A3G9J1U7_9BACL|nr:class I SAM-dependent methyltransferase [Paenibacillus baekrokdamisoli]MBB3071435.1 ubiquinone/menaquinone biosynthesis C-methylase UbiE [Paenibacillus baekrokdamisoli]BBH24532.1 hypothetical protein Back11_58770 [Paenibacillus baekrokdamisoli]
MKPEVNNHVVDYYTSFGEREWSRLDREPLEFTVNWHYMKKYLPSSGCILDNGAGPGKYAMELARCGYQITLTDLTPHSVELAEIKAAELGLEQHFAGFHIQNATHLDALSNVSFDASLMLGPLYHLQKADERSMAVKELYRVTKPGGVVFVAFRNRTNHVLTSLLRPDHWKPNDNVDTIEAFYESGIFNHQDEGRYTGAYYYPVEEINPFMEEHGFEGVELIGSTNLGTLLSQEHWNMWINKGETEHKKLISFLIKMAREPSILGISSHLLYIGRKK